MLRALQLRCSVPMFQLLRKGNGCVAMLPLVASPPLSGELGVYNRRPRATFVVLTANIDAHELHDRPFPMSLSCCALLKNELFTLTVAVVQLNDALRSLSSRNRW